MLFILGKESCDRIKEIKNCSGILLIGNHYVRPVTVGRPLKKMVGLEMDIKK